MALLRALVLSLVGLALAAGAFFLASGWFAGSGQAIAAHLALAGIALPLFLLAARMPRIRPALLAAGAGLLVFGAVSALVFPTILRNAASAAADGRNFCLLGPKSRIDGDDGRYPPYSFGPAPRAWADLTFLTLPRPLTLVARASDPGADRTFGRPVRAFAIYDWSEDDLAFRADDPVVLRALRPSSFVDCVPLADPFAEAPGDWVEAVVVLRPRLSGEEFDAKWGPPQTDHYRLPLEAAPWHEGRFGRGTLGFGAEIIPGAGRFRLAIDYTPFPEAFLAKVLEGRVRDQDAPLDFATLALNGFGLHAYEHPATYDPAVTEGTYAAFAPDGEPVTVIACDGRSCRHSFRPPPGDQPAQWIVTVTYPPDRLPDWRVVETAALARIAQALAPP